MSLMEIYQMGEMNRRRMKQQQKRKVKLCTLIDKPNKWLPHMKREKKILQ